MGWEDVEVVGYVRRVAKIWACGRNERNSTKGSKCGMLERIELGKPLWCRAQYHGSACAPIVRVAVQKSRRRKQPTCENHRTGNSQSITQAGKNYSRLAV